jgi:tryptophan synthase alpha chain
MLEQYIRDRLKEKPILLMTHIVIGYPDLKTSAAVVAAMVDSGVDLMELQIPFSEPIADGPVIESANQRALAAGITVKDCLAFAGEIASSYPIPFLFMSYLNILDHFGMERFAREIAARKLAGAIVPDLPHEEAGDYCAAFRTHGLEPVFLFAPTTPEERMREIAGHGSGFIYCVARKGVTGRSTAFGASIEGYLAQARRATKLPLAVGFGIKEKKDIDFLKGKAEIAVIGSEMIRVAEREGPAGVAARLRSFGA